MADHHHRCPACGAGAPRGAGFCPTCGTALDAPSLPFDALPGQMATEHEVALGAGRGNPRRSALIVGVVAVAVIGAGLVVGAGSGDEGGAEGSPSPSTSIERPTTTERDRSPRTTVDRSTTTTALAMATTPIPELAGQMIYAIVDGRVVRVDPTTGTATPLTDGRRAQDWSALVARQGGVVLSDDSSVFLPDDGSAPVDLDGGQAWATADPALVWVAGFFGPSPAATARLVRVETGDEVIRVDVPPFAYPVGDDGTGRLVLHSSTGGTYAIDPGSGGISRLTESGLVMAATATHLVQLRCDAQLVCGHELVDRASGGVVPVPLGAEAAAFPGMSGFALDPTASRMAWIDYSASPRLSVIELASGTVTELGGGIQDSGPGNAPRWTADGQHLVWVDRSSIAVWTVGTDEAELYPFRSGERLASVTAVTLGG